MDSFSPFVKNIVRYVAVGVATVGGDPTLGLYTYIHTIKPGSLPLAKHKISSLYKCCYIVVGGRNLRRAIYIALSIDCVSFIRE